MRFAESVVKEAAIAWLESASWRIRNGDEIAKVGLQVREAKRVIEEATA